MNEYEELYDKIQDVTNDVITWTGFNILNHKYEPETEEMLRTLQECATVLSSKAHELEEKLAWG